MAKITGLERWAGAAVVLTLLCGAQPSVARAEPLPFGLRAGLVEARLQDDLGKLIGGDYRSGFTMSTWLRVPLGGGFSIRPELQLINKGGSKEYHLDINNFKVDYSLTYLELPALLQFTVPTGGGWSPYLVLGPAAALRVADDVSFEPPTAVPSTAQRAAARTAQIFESLSRPEFRDFDFLVIGGAGAIIGSGKARLAVDLRYEYGLANIFSLGNAIKTEAIAAAVGLELH